MSCMDHWCLFLKLHDKQLVLNILPTEAALQVLKRKDNVTVSNQQGRFVIVCNITSYSSDASAFEVTWWRGQASGEGEPHPIFRARRDFTLELLDQSREHLLFGRPRAALYTLTVPEARPSDSGLYYCHVEEWLLSPRDSWRKIAEDTSGCLHVSFQAQGRGPLACNTVHFLSIKSIMQIDHLMAL